MVCSYEHGNVLQRPVFPDITNVMLQVPNCTKSALDVSVGELHCFLYYMNKVRINCCFDQRIS